jgi:myo-inositol 2-dehydrogenase / D-chiro-inositol 1-dehydrogenase
MDVARTSLGVALLGVGRMGSFHAGTLAHRIPGARLVAVADPAPGRAERAAATLGAGRAYAAPADAIADGAVDAVVIAAPARCHADLVATAATAGRHVFCEKPMALTLADAERAIAAARAAGVVLQVGFNRRFAADWRAARELLDAGRLGTPRLLRSLTRDPGGFDPATVPPDAIFTETLIHDFDTLRFLNPGAEAVEAYTAADALVAPAWRERGLLDTGVVTVRFDNGAIGTAEACFEAVYGYDVRGEVFGAGGVATMGAADAAASDQELFGDAYVAELAAFVEAVRARTAAPVTGEDARAALAIALAAAESARAGGPVRIVR